MPIYFSDYKIEIFKNPAAYINSRGGHFIYIYGKWQYLKVISGK